MLDRTINEYTFFAKQLLKWSFDNRDYLADNGTNKAGKYTEKTIKQLLPVPSDAHIASALKDGLVSNTASMLASYFALQKSDSQDTTGFPTILEHTTEAYTSSLETLANIFLQNSVDATKEEAEQQEAIAAANLMRVAKDISFPLYFCRSRDFTILADTQQHRIFAYLKLNPNKDTSNLQNNISGNNLVDASTGEVFSKRPGVGVLFPVEIGERGWQYDDFILPCIQQLAHPKAAKLIRQGDDYYLHVSFAFDCPDPYEPESYLGVDRGVFFTASYAVVDLGGAVLLKNSNPDGYRDAKISAGKRVQDKQRKGKSVSAKDYKGKYLDGLLHIIANNLIKVALDHKSKVVMEDLNISIRSKFYKSAWKKLHWIVEYKCKLAGVPFKKSGVWAAWTSKLCIICGEEVERPERDTVICPTCGNIEHADEAASVNIARRAMYKKSEWGGTDKKPGDWRAFHRSFANASGFCAKIDLRQMEEVKQLELV